jgi:putative glycosyltransferase (TIGR04348 family)
MRVLIVCPAPPRSRHGNRVTAVRWARLLRQLGHRARIVTELGDTPCDVVVALHARRSAGAVARSRELAPHRPIVVALTGTDLYKDLPTNDDALRSLALADALVVLQRHGVADLPRPFRKKAFVIPQSAEPPKGAPRRRRDRFEVAVVGHLRDEKDPFRAAEASRLLPKSSRVAIVHAGAALSPAMRARAEAEARDNPRYTWLGEVSPARARALIARARLLVLSSRVEGGANVLSEAILAGTPIVASRIPSTIGVLGARHPGLYPFGDTGALARRLARLERDPAALVALARASAARRGELTPACERAAWRKLLASLAITGRPRAHPGR